jgi:hypothetical protein
MSATVEELDAEELELMEEEGGDAMEEEDADEPEEGEQEEVGKRARSIWALSVDRMPARAARTQPRCTRGHAVQRCLQGRV